MSICDNTTVNQETTLKLQTIRKTKISCKACRKTFNEPKIKRSNQLSMNRIQRWEVPCTKVPRYFCTPYFPPLDSAIKEVFYPLDDIMIVHFKDLSDALILISYIRSTMYKI